MVSGSSPHYRAVLRRARRISKARLAAPGFSVLMASNQGDTRAWVMVSSRKRPKEIRVILDYGAGFIDHRGWYANAGA